VKHDRTNRAQVLMFLVRNLELTEDEAKRSVARADRTPGKWTIAERNLAKIRRDGNLFSVEEYP